MKKIAVIGHDGTLGSELMKQSIAFEVYGVRDITTSETTIQIDISPR